MVAQPKQVLNIAPEIRLAQRLLERRALVPAIDVESILKEYASVEYVRFPVAIDGLCLDLKAIGKRPTVLVSEQSSLVRRRFTLAHEIGHVLIPWHIGSIMDEIDAVATSDDDYFKFEAEANRFASELLMPSPWVDQKFISFENPLDALFDISKTAVVSLQAALIKFNNCLPPDYVIAQSKAGRVIWSAKSFGTLAATVGKGTDLSIADPYQFPCERWTKTYGGSTYHIWHFTTLADVTPETTPRAWQEILDEIVCDIETAKIARQKFKASISGVTSNANCMIKENRLPDVIATAMIQRLYASAVMDEKYRKLVEHPNFMRFCEARAAVYASG